MNRDQTKLTIKAVLTYDAEVMHSGDRDPEARDWFMSEVLRGDNLILHDNGAVGDTIGTLSQVELVTQNDAAELRAAAQEHLEALDAWLKVSGAEGNPIRHAAQVDFNASILALRAALAASEGES